MTTPVVSRLWHEATLTCDPNLNRDEFDKVKSRARVVSLEAHHVGREAAFLADHPECAPMVKVRRNWPATGDTEATGLPTQ